MRCVIAILLSLATLQPFESPTHAGSLASIAGTIVAPVNRQAGVLNLDVPRPRLLTSLQPPLYAANLDVSPGGQAAIEVRDTVGGDIMRLDLSSGTLSPLVMRSSTQESLSVPVWQSDGARLFFERDDLLQTPVSYANQANIRSPARIEAASSDGGDRSVLVGDGRMPGVSHDGSRLAYVRSSAVGTALLEQDLAGGAERELLPTSRFPDIAYPRFSPDATTLAFVAVAPFVGKPMPWLGFGVRAAYAHGLPWNVWLIDANGGEPRELAELEADDPSVAWAPDGRQVFVYSGSGSSIVDVRSGEVASYPYLAGYGATAWTP